MPVFKYRDPQTGEWINVAGGGKGVEIPITSNPAEDVQIWIDPEEGENSEVSYTRSQILSNQTKYDFGMDAGITPNDIFAYLSQYNQHWWSILHGQAGYGYEELRTIKTTEQGTSTSITVHDSSTQTISYSKEISINQSTGEISLVNPQTQVVRGATTSDAVKASLNPIINMAPVYITNLYASPNTIYYIPAGATWTGFFYNYSTETFGASRTGDGYMPVLNTMASCTIPPYVVTSQIYNISAGETTYVYSVDRNSYPDSGTVDSLTYQYLGVPFENAVTAPKIATGSYTGTGKYGSNNKNSLTFDFEPQLVILANVNSYNGIPMHAIFQRNQSSYIYYTGGPVSWSGKTMSWYTTETNASNGANYQLNTSGKTYNYIAIG